MFRYLKFSQSASLSWHLSLHSKSPRGKSKRLLQHPLLLPLISRCSQPGPWASGACALSSFSTPAPGRRGLLVSISRSPSRLTVQPALVPAHQSLTCPSPTPLHCSGLVLPKAPSLPPLLHLRHREKTGENCSPRGALPLRPPHSHSPFAPRSLASPFT